jgi:hypothetical protein
MATSARTTSRKSAARQPGAPSLARDARETSLAHQLSDVLDVLRLHAASFPARVERTKILLALDSEARLELEVSGSSEAEFVPESHEHAWLAHDAGLEAPGKSIDELDLGAAAKAAAQKLLSQFPGQVIFTSGRRSIASQASAMAPNVVKNRKWIQQTYKDTPQRAALQKWVDEHPDATVATAVAAGLQAVMTTWSEDQQRNFSRHISGDAFDVQPVAGSAGDRIKEAIGKLPKLHWHTFEEGGLEIWHAQFNP